MVKKNTKMKKNVKFSYSAQKLKFRTVLFPYKLWEENIRKQIEIPHVLTHFLILPSSLSRYWSAPKKKCYDTFLRAALTGHSHPSPFWKIAKMALHEIIFGPNAFFWSAKKVPFSDFIQNMSLAPSMCLFMWIKVDK